MYRSTYYAKLDSTYRQVLLKLENDLSLIENNPREENVSSYELIREFATNYLTPNKLWDKFWEFYNGHQDDRLTILQLSTYHFSYNDDMTFDLPHNSVISRRKLMDKNSRYEIYGMFNKNVTIEDLCFPNNLLEFYLYFYENLNTNRHLPQKIIKRNKEMKKLYKKIKAVEENEEAWIKAMEEADDIDFVKQNLEKKLGEDLTNKKLWILYIKYLKEYDIKELLQVYSKYCRFFVDDVGMKEEYQKAAKKYGKVAVAWKNAFSFEKSDESLFDVNYDEIPESPPRERAVIRNHVPLKILFNSKEVATQNFPFQSRLIDYIGETAKAQVLQKLNFSCKYFYNKYRIPVCNYLFILTSGPAWATFDIEKEALIFHSNTMKEVDFNNLYIMTRFHYHHNIPLGSLIPKLYKCDAKYIDISDEQLTMDEFKFFIGHGNVIDLRFCRLKITDGNGEQLFVEDILAFTPKLQYLIANYAYCSSNTVEKLCELPFKKKFMEFSLRNGLNVSLDPNAVGEFINKHASPYCRITINGVGDDFSATVNSVIDNYWKTNHKPAFSTFGFF